VCVCVLQGVAVCCSVLQVCCSAFAGGLEEVCVCARMRVCISVDAIVSE